MPDKTCSKCSVPKSLDDFIPRAGAADGRRGECRECTRRLQRGWDRLRRAARQPASAERWPHLAKFDTSDVDEDLAATAGEPIDEPTEAMIAFGTAIERACAEALLRLGSVELAAEELVLTPSQLRAHLSELQRRSAARGYAPGGDMTRPTPEGFHVKGVSTLYDGDGAIRAQWVKTNKDEDDRVARILDAMSTIAHRWQGLAEPVEPPALELSEDLLAVYPMGDPHVGMFSWGQETGNNHDLAIAERNLYGAVDRLVELAPPAKQALVVSVGDFFHSDNRANTTTNGTPVDSDGRWPKVLSVGIRLMRRVIDRALTKHESVHVICEIGNHDWHTSIMLSTCLAQFYERDPRVTIDTSPAKYHKFRFGQTLIATTHGDTVKLLDLGEVMAADWPEDWGETRHRYWLTGHIHHDTLKELRGCIVESFRTLAPADAWHRGQGYRSGRDMKLLVFHRRWGQINRHVVGIDQVLRGLDGHQP